MSAFEQCDCSGDCQYDIERITEVVLVTEECVLTCNVATALCHNTDCEIQLSRGSCLSE